ncbi:sugar nucleotide-binding protein [Rhodospirillum sp. A1_3_36]|uniref:sugar nucleotide-binding protein n=1 Tax=Rhodospirillum sp. A1_3_36 TaxID=3391666 RepID=UPI0039A4931B
MADKRSFLVVGGDSLVGGSTVRALKARGHEVHASTRRPDTLEPGRVLVDFEKEETYRAPDGVDYAFVIAAATNYERCETDPMAKVINVELIPRLVASLLDQGLFVTFISTNSVFGGERPWPHEDDAHTPGIAYAQQKADGEREVLRLTNELGARDRLNITRLTKIMDSDTPPLPNWLASWNRGETITPFADLIFAPMSVRFVGDALATIGEKRVPGNLHLSGADNVSYVDFAQALARHLGYGASVVEPTTSTAKGVHIAFKPTYSGLGMTRTRDLTGLEPQSLDALIRDLFPAGHG